MGMNFGQMEETFAQQFEAESDGFVFRLNGNGAPIRISAAERDGFIAAYKRDIRFAAWGMMAAIVAMAFVIIALPPAGYSGDLPDLPFFFGFGLLVVIFVASTMWAGRAPARALAGRPATGAALTKAEIRRNYLESLDYKSLAFAAAAGVILLLRYEREQPLFSGWNLFVVAVFVLLEGGMAFTAFRKWRFERLQKAGAGERPRWG